LTQNKRLKSGKIRITSDVRKKTERGRRAIAAAIDRLSAGSFAAIYQRSDARRAKLDFRNGAK
jgi:hypothetical protein